MIAIIARIIPVYLLHITLPHKVSKPWDWLIIWLDCLEIWQAPVKLQNGRTILSTNLGPSRLSEICLTIRHIVRYWIPALAGERLTIKTSFYQYKTPIVKIRRSPDRLIFIMEIPYLKSRSLYWDRALVLTIGHSECNETEEGYHKGQLVEPVHQQCH